MTLQAILVVTECCLWGKHSLQQWFLLSWALRVPFITAPCQKEKLTYTSSFSHRDMNQKKFKNKRNVFLQQVLSRIQQENQYSRTPQSLGTESSLPFSLFLHPYFTQIYLQLIFLFLVKKNHRSYSVKAILCFLNSVYLISEFSFSSHLHFSFPLQLNLVQDCFQLLSDEYFKEQGTAQLPLGPWSWVLAHWQIKEMVENEADIFPQVLLRLCDER